MGFDPISMAVIGVGGAAVSAYGAYQKGQANAAAATYQSQVAANNAIIAQENERMAAASGAAKEAAYGMKTRAAVGQTKATQGASGVDVKSGSAADVRASEAELGMLDTATIRSNTSREAYGYRVKEVSETAQSQLDLMEAEQAKSGGVVGALGTFLSGASSVGGKYAKMQYGDPSGGG